ncbi:MAG: hypothetical protein NTW58_01540 [Actinobacteria bacterium]|nr:hypothetical protein [Actinomycetota bacterium]
MDDAPTAPLPYLHTQIGYPILVGMALGSLTQVRALLRDKRAGRPRWWSYVPGWLAFAALMLAFSRLTVVVDGTHVSVGFGGGLARRRFELHTIETASVVKTPWLAGWGIRLTRQGWLYNAWGRGAVQLRFAGGRRFTIGTNEPEALLAAIQRAREGLVAE